MPSPKCIVLKSKQQGLELTDDDLVAMAKTIPFASECLACDRRRNDALEKMCWKNV